MTEDQKYQGALYKDKSKKQNQNQNQNQNQTQNHNNNNNNYSGHSQPANPRQTNFNDDSYNNYDNSKAMVRHAYVEDCFEDREYDWNEYVGQTDDGKSPAEPPPEAPTPPSAHNEDHVNVFDFMIATGQTPNASTLSLAHDGHKPDPAESTSLVRYESKDDEYLESTSYMDGAEPLIEYGSGPVPTHEFVTPAPKHERRKHKDSDVKKDKKRKRLHVDVPSDQDMADAPPVLHSGLTGGLNRMMRPVFPPSPDYSGNDIPEVSPASPLKKTKHAKHAKHGQVSNSLFGMIAGPPKTKIKTKKHKTSTKKSSNHHKDGKVPKLIEYRPRSKDGLEEAGESQMVLFKPRADVFLSFINKGPESERGCSMNKALKRFHRERQEAGTTMGKGAEEKELWKSLRLRHNERGEIVLFSI